MGDRLVSDRCLSVCLVSCNFGVLWPNGWMDQDATWYVLMVGTWMSDNRWHVVLMLHGFFYPGCAFPKFSLPLSAAKLYLNKWSVI